MISRAPDNTSDSKSRGEWAMRFDGHGSAAFTLIELLVVMAIIALLIGIFLPALSAARRTAKDIQCRSNLRQIGTAVVSYGNDHEGRLPDSGSDDDTSGGDLVGELQPYLNTRWGTGVWVCPSHDAFARRKGWTGSYGYNWQYLLVPGPDYPHSQWNSFNNQGFRPSALEQPTDALLFVDHSAPGGSGDLWTYVQRPKDEPHINGFGRVAFRHNDHANVAYADGHVEAGPTDLDDALLEGQYWNPRN